MSKGIGREFMEKTKYQYLEESDQSKGLTQPSLQLDYDKTQETIELPTPKDLNIKEMNLIEAIEGRSSLRKYDKTPLTIEELSYLLWCTQGVKQIVSRPATVRTVPSAGARHAFETYLLINNVEGLQPGIYIYLAIEHRLIQENMDENIKEQVIGSCLNQKFIGNSAVTFIWVASSYRMKWRYGERGYRYLHLDAGHVCQNLYLASENIECGTCAIAAFDDDKVNDLLDLDDQEQFAIYIASVGKKLKNK